MSTLKVDLDNLKPGVKYSFLSEFFPGIKLEGRFDRKIQKLDRNNQYIFRDCVSYDENGRQVNRGLINFGNSDWYPTHIFVVASNKLPGDLNEYINKFGGKSRKSKRRRRRKSTRRYNKKSKRR
jgi:hypothetical protein